MTSRKPTIPAHLTAYAMSEDETWRRLEFQFAELRSLVEHARLETAEEAMGERRKPENRSAAEWTNTAPTWFDPDINMTTKAWLLIPYIDGIGESGRSDLADRIDSMRMLIPPLEAKFKERTITHEFLLLWGMFCKAAGSLEFINNLETSVGHLRSAHQGGEGAKSINSAQKRWFSHYFLRFYKGRGSRQESEEQVERIVNATTDNPDSFDLGGFDAKWFDELLDLDDPKSERYGKLKAMYLADALPIDKIKRFAKQSCDDLPPLDIGIPGTKNHP